MAVLKNHGAYYVVHRDPTGKQIWTHCGRGLDGQKKAYDLNDTLKETGALRAYGPQNQGSPSFAELANHYLKARMADLPKPSIDNLHGKLRSVILPELGHIPASQITARVLDQYITARRQKGVVTRIGPRRKQRSIPAIDREGRVRTVKLTTIHRELTDIQAILNWAADPQRGYIAANPVAGYKKPRRDDERMTPPSPAEVRAILEHLPEHARRALTISYYSGVRPGAELFGICWHDVDLDGRTILIRSARKGGPAYRLLPLHDDLQAALSGWCLVDQTIKDRPPQVILYKGCPVRSIKRSFITAKRLAGITRRLRLYDFRHAFASDLIAAGADTRSVSQLLGHSRPDTTSRIYVHTNLDLLRQQINRRRGI